MSEAIFPIRLRISTAYLILGKQAVLVDTGSPGEQERILRGLQRYNVEPHRLALLLHTHGHVDHAGSTRTLRESLGIPAAVHRGDAAKLRAGHSGKLIPLRFSSRVLAWFLDPRFPAIEPDLEIEEGFSLQEFGISATVVHTPGHTPGSISVLFEDGRAIAGDLMMGGGLGGLYHATRPGYHYFAEDLTELRRSIRKLLDRGAKTIFLGHGGPVDAAHVHERFAADLAGFAEKQ